MTDFEQKVLDVVEAHPGIYTGEVKDHFPSRSASAVTGALNRLYGRRFIRHPSWNETRRWEVTE